MESDSSIVEIPRGSGRDLSRSRLIVDLDALSYNLELIRTRLDGSADILPVVKADAYGHGMVPVSRHLLGQSVPALAVMGLEEGIQLRQEDIQTDILVLGGILPSEMEECLDHRLIPVIHNRDLLDAVMRLPPVQPIRIHLKCDIGMGRLGFLPEDLGWVCDKIGQKSHIHVEGVMTHFPLGEDPDETDQHVTRFESMVDTLWQSGIIRCDRLVVHMANSAAFLSGRYSASQTAFAWKQGARYWVRPGLILYGIPVDPDSPGLTLKPVMEVQARLISLKTLPAGSRISYGGTRVLTRKSRVGVLGMGYADGLPRELSNWGWATREGQRFPFLGRICMDMVMVDLTDAVFPLGLGDWMTLLGNGTDQSMTAWDIARHIRSIPYEIVCRLGNRSPRLYARKSWSSGNTC
uniref:Alanine racemase n=1 Tax=Leptospirillum ferriphilum TaxID=178606 RepID=A0A7C3R568_9BACT